ncbi:hypothetical protein EMIT0P43_20044 [Pseudomonas jessenii]
MKPALPDLKGKGFDQGDLLAVVETELSGGLVDEFELPGNQGQAVFQGTQRLVVQTHGVLCVVQQAMNMQRKFRHGRQRQGISLVGQLEQCAEQTVDGVLVIADQLQMTQAFLGFSQECFSLDKKPRETLGPLFTVVRHTYLHNVMSNEGISCVSTRAVGTPALPSRRMNE